MSSTAARRHAEEIGRLHRESEQEVPRTRRHLERFTESVLQVTLLSDRRAAKLVRMVEELRRDLDLPVREDDEEGELRTAAGLRAQRQELRRTLEGEPGAADEEP